MSLIRDVIERKDSSKDAIKCIFFHMRQKLQSKMKSPSESD